jgi:predicted nucleic acid-binding protein
VPLFTEDAFSDRAESLIAAAAQSLLVSDLTSAEFASVLARQVRTGALAADGASAAFLALDAWKLRLPTPVALEPSDFAEAERLMRRLDLALRTPDALHLAVTTRLQAELATFDKRLARDAAALGLTVVGS